MYKRQVRYIVADQLIEDAEALGLREVYADEAVRIARAEGVPVVFGTDLLGHKETADLVRALLVASGNDAAAKAEVSRLLAEWFGWRDIIDLGDITTARGTEELLPVWVRLMMMFGHANFQFKIVR